MPSSLFAQATTVATKGDMTAFVVENPMAIGGWGNGYVAIGKHHRLYEAPEGVLDDLLTTHKGVTYNQLANGYYVIGFDTMHLSDNRENCDKDFVIAETKALLEQLANLAG